MLHPNYLHYCAIVNFYQQFATGSSSTEFGFDQCSQAMWIHWFLDCKQHVIFKVMVQLQFPKKYESDVALLYDY